MMDALGLVFDMRWSSYQLKISVNRNKTMFCSHIFKNFEKLLVALILALVCCNGIEFRYGQHFPNGEAAVNYIYSQNGTWKSFTPLNYEWNYYEKYATPEHPFDKGALINAANGSRFYTARDANGYLLCDPDHDFEINPNYCPPGGFSTSFHEHNGIKAGGLRGGAPFTQFWFDDNYLARFMSRAYLRPDPRGLVEQEQGSFVRWSVLGGNLSNYSPYNSTHFDTLALDGLFYLGSDNLTFALKAWNASLELSEAIWNVTEGTWLYPGIEENYHVGLWAAFTNFLLDSPQLSPGAREVILQHSVSLRRSILRNQEVDQGTGQLLGWISNVGSDSALINTESVSCSVLGLGANAKFVFEFDRNYRKSENFALFYDQDDHGVVNGRSRTGGPSFPLPSGPYSVEFVFRTRNFSRILENRKEIPIVGRFLVVQVSSSSGEKSKMTIIEERPLMGTDFKENDSWVTVSLEVDILEVDTKDEGHEVGVVYDFVVEWDSGIFGNIEISAVILK